MDKNRFLKQGGKNSPTGTYSDILNFPNYFKHSEVEEGSHGPEENGEIVYISVYHYMQYNNDRYDPKDYDTLRIGGELLNHTKDVIPIKYNGQSFWINKYPFDFLKAHESVFERFKLDS